MKALIVSMLTAFSLNASMFDNYTKAEPLSIKSRFIKNISDANAVIKKGNYERFHSYKDGIRSTIGHIEKLDISKDEKLELKSDLNTYANIINKIYKKMHKEAPEFNKHYKKSIEGLKKFNTKLSSIGYRPLLNLWHNLSKTKGRFVKRPSKKLQDKFNEDYKLMIINITELYLDDEIEQPLLNYLKNYKTHFDEMNLAYESIGYNNITILRPLSYKIKAKMEFLTPVNL